MEDFKNQNFFTDFEKMRDFAELSKEEFLASYSYLTEDEYDNTKRLYDVSIIEYCPHCENEQVIECKFDVQICPNCGRPILPCSLCDDCVWWKKCPLYDKEMEMNKQLGFTD